MAEYLLGHSPAELQRLTLQAELLRPITERMLREAGLAPGMRVLDLGCGAGDESFLMADLVGPDGNVVGIDRAATAIQFASQRAEVVHARNVTFRQATETDLGDDTPFDLIVGRYVLVHQPDPASFVRAAAARLRSGGVLAFHELDLSRDCKSLPPIPIFDHVVNEIVHAIRTTAPSPDAAIQLGATFADAGLTAPDGFCERLVGMERSELFFRWIAASYAVIRSATDPDGEPVEVGRLAAEFQTAVMAVHGQALAIDQWCVWATT